jgi:hypothetical protein
MIAANSARWDICKLILQYNIDINHRANDQKTVMYILYDLSSMVPAKVNHSERF